MAASDQPRLEESLNASTVGELLELGERCNANSPQQAELRRPLDSGEISPSTTDNRACHLTASFTHRNDATSLMKPGELAVEVAD